MRRAKTITSKLRRATSRVTFDDDENPLARYSSGESDFDNTRNDFMTLTEEERPEHLFELWRLAFLKSMGAASVKRIFTKLQNRIITYGSVKNINRTKADVEQYIISKKPGIVFLQEHWFKRFWNMLVIVLLAYVAMFMPYNICFT